MTGSQSYDAVILAGGRGTRLQAVVSDVPKPLAPVNGRPFLDYQFALLAQSGVVSRVILSLGHQAQKVIDHYAQHPPPLPTTFIVEQEPLGTGGGLRLALSDVQSTRLFTMNGDSLFRWDLPALIAAHEATRPAATLALVEVPDTSRYGAVTVEDGRVTAFLEKSEARGPGLINAGLNLFERSALEAIPEGRPVSLEQEVYPELVRQGRLNAVGFASDFIDIGLPETYSAASTVLPVLATPL